MLVGFDLPAPADERDPTAARWLETWLAEQSARRKERRSRRQVARLMTFSDQMLRDLGVTREDIRWAAGRPMTVDAGELLNRIARRAR